MDDPIGKVYVDDRLSITIQGYAPVTETSFPILPTGYIDSYYIPAATDGCFQPSMLVTEDDTGKNTVLKFNQALTVDKYISYTPGEVVARFTAVFICK
jgi:hypothetical protein